MKGIILAGGSGTRLYPITKAISKQLMPIFDKPMIYYPLSTLMKAGINEILIITTPYDQINFKNLLGDGTQLGCKFVYKVQESPKGLADTYNIANDFIDGNNSMMVLGDNLFYGSEIDTILESIKTDFTDGGRIFGYWVANPRAYGVLEIDDKFKVISIEEKPEKPKSNYAIPGMYVFDKNACEFVKNAKPSARGELEITEIMQGYLDKTQLTASLINRGSAWLDTGTFSAMNQASQFVQVIEERQGVKIGCIEEEAYRQGFINSEQLEKLAYPLLKSGYGQYLMEVLNNNILR